MLFDKSKKYDQEIRNEYLHKFDKLFNLLDRIAYATLTMKVLTSEEAGNFGWYLDEIAGHDGLARYCAEEGYHGVLDLAATLEADVYYV